MDYRDILGFSKKSKEKKEVIPKAKKPSLSSKLKEQFGPLNEWTDTSFRDKPRRWGGAFNGDGGLTEFEETGGKDNVNEGPAYEYSKFIKKIEKSRDSFGKDVLNFYELLRKKGLDDEAHDLLDDYKKYVIKFGLKFKKFVRTLL